MKLDGALKGGIAGVTTLGLLSKTLGGANGQSSHLLSKSKLKKRLRKTGSKHGLKATKEYLQLAEDILASGAYFGFNSLTKKKHAMLKGGILGTVAGLGNVFLNSNDHDYLSSERAEHDDKLSSKLLKVSLYTIGGLIAGKLVEDAKKKMKKKK